jgi:hypothetical protein
MGILSIIARKLGTKRKPSIKVGGRTMTLDEMHSAEGTKFFMKLPKEEQMKFSEFDRNESRKLIPKG